MMDEDLVLNATELTLYRISASVSAVIDLTRKRTHALRQYRLLNHDLLPYNLCSLNGEHEMVA